MCVCACVCDFAHSIFQCSFGNECVEFFFIYFIFRSSLWFSSFRIVGEWWWICNPYDSTLSIFHVWWMVNGEWRMANLHTWNCHAWFSVFSELMNAWWNCKCFFWLTARWSSSSTSGRWGTNEATKINEEQARRKRGKMLNLKGRISIHSKVLVSWPVVPMSAPE